MGNSNAPAAAANDRKPKSQQSHASGASRHHVSTSPSTTSGLAAAAPTSPPDKFKINNAIVGQGASAAHLFRRLRLEPAQIDAFYHVFKLIDEDSSHEIDVSEFHEYFDLEQSDFSTKVFNMFDADDSGLIDFAEFVAATWFLCTVARDELHNVLFKFYDKEEEEEVEDAGGDGGEHVGFLTYGRASSLITMLLEAEENASKKKRKKQHNNRKVQAHRRRQQQQQQRDLDGIHKKGTRTRALHLELSNKKKIAMLRRLRVLCEDYTSSSMETTPSISPAGFRVLVAQYPVLLRPMLRLQKTLRTNILGIDYWTQTIYHRQKTLWKESTKDFRRAIKAMDSTLTTRERRNREEDATRRDQERYGVTAGGPFSSSGTTTAAAAAASAASTEKWALPAQNSSSSSSRSPEVDRSIATILSHSEIEPPRVSSFPQFLPRAMSKKHKGTRVHRQDIGRRDQRKDRVNRHADDEVQAAMRMVSAVRAVQKQKAAFLNKLHGATTAGCGGAADADWVTNHAQKKQRKNRSRRSPQRHTLDSLPSARKAMDQQQQQWQGQWQDQHGSRFPEPGLGHGLGPAPLPPMVPASKRSPSRGYVNSTTLHSKSGSRRRHTNDSIRRTPSASAAAASRRHKDALNDMKQLSKKVASQLSERRRDRSRRN